MMKYRRSRPMSQRRRQQDQSLGPAFLVVLAVIGYTSISTIGVWPTLLLLALGVFLIIAFKRGWHSSMRGMPVQSTQQRGQEQADRQRGFTPPYQPPQEQPSSEEPALRYEQGYQEQPPVQSAPSWTPFSGLTRNDRSIPKQDRPSDYEQAQAQYPEQRPPMQH